MPFLPFLPAPQPHQHSLVRCTGWDERAFPPLHFLLLTSSLFCQWHDFAPRWFSIGDKEWKCKVSVVVIETLRFKILEIPIGYRLKLKTLTKEAFSRDFLGGPVVKNPPYKAENAGSIPGQGTKIPHASEQLISHTTTTELEHSGAHLLTARQSMDHNEDPACCN